MSEETVVIDNLPDVQDINVLLEAIEKIGAKIERIEKPTGHTVKINSSNIDSFIIDYDFIRKIRASYYLLELY